MNMTELKPCPFCGGEAEHYEDGYMQHYVVCTRRGCYARSFGFESEAEAIDAWNTRAVDACKNIGDLSHGVSDIFECSECGYGYSDIYLNDEDRYQFVPNYCPNCGAKVVSE